MPSPRDQPPRRHQPLLSGLDRSVPALQRAFRMQSRCAEVGFDWNAPEGARDKLMEEIGELDAAMAQRDPDAIRWELGDMILAAINVARLLDVNAEQALHDALDRFQNRFARMEEELAARGLRPEQVDLDTLESLWQKAKSSEH